MRIKNTEERFGIIAIILHWLIAILMIGLIILGLYMVDLPINLEKLKLYGWHKEYGFLVLGLAILRLIWRLSNISPTLDIPRWEAISAKLVHWTFYGFMFGLPITGWLLTSSAGIPASLFGLITLPNLVTPSDELRILFQALHKWLSYVLAGLIILHTAAALKHHFIDKDNVLRRMIS